jgi:hypothetical protein
MSYKMKGESGTRGRSENRREKKGEGKEECKRDRQERAGKKSLKIII